MLSAQVRRTSTTSTGMFRWVVPRSQPDVLGPTRPSVVVGKEKKGEKNSCSRDLGMRLILGEAEFFSCSGDWERAC